jgi:N utilization substance protein A
VRLASELTEWKIELYSSREWMERGTDQPIFAPLPTDEPVSGVNPRLVDIEGMQPATVAVLEEAGYKTLDDIIDLEREDFLRLPGIAPEEADRLMAIINELTTDEAPETAEEAVVTTEADVEASSEMASEGGSAAVGGIEAAPDLVPETEVKAEGTKPEGKKKEPKTKEAKKTE